MFEDLYLSFVHLNVGYKICRGGGGRAGTVFFPRFIIRRINLESWCLGKQAICLTANHLNVSLRSRSLRQDTGQAKL